MRRSPVLLFLALLAVPTFADQYVRHATAAQAIIVGPFVDDSDFKTAEEELTIENTDVKLFKPGATEEVDKNSGGCSHLSNGRYYCVLDDDDTDTLGTMRVSIKVAGALEVWEDVHVLSTVAFDGLYGEDPLATAANVSAVETDTQDIQSRLPAALVSGRMDVSVGAVQSNAITAAGLAADVTTELQTGLATAATAATIVAYVDDLESRLTSARAAKLDNIPAAAAGSNGGLPTVDGSNRIAGIQGTITTLDALDAAQDLRHDTTQAVTTKLDTALEADGGVYRFTANALEESPASGGDTAAAIATAVREELAEELALIDVAISSRASDEDLGGIASVVDGLPDAATVASAVRDELSTELGRIDASISSRAAATDLGTVDGVVDGIAVITAKLDTALEADGEVYRFTSNALEQGPAADVPTASAVADAVRSELSTELGRIDASISSRAADADLDTARADIASILAAVDTEVAAILSAVEGLPAAQAIADAVRSELATELERIDAAISTRAADADLTEALGLLAGLPDAVADEAYEGTITLRQAVRLMLAVAVGKSSGHNVLAPVYRDANDTKPRVTGVQDASGNRLSVTLDAE